MYHVSASDAYLLAKTLSLAKAARQAQITEYSHASISTEILTSPAACADWSEERWDEIHHYHLRLAEQCKQTALAARRVTIIQLKLKGAIPVEWEC